MNPQLAQFLLDPNAVAIVSEALPNAKRAKFLTAVNLLNDSLVAGEWIPGTSRKVGAGFDQGLARSPRERYYDAKNQKAQEEVRALARSIEFGLPFDGNLDLAAKTFFDYCEKHPSYTATGKTKPSFAVSEKVVRSWVHLCNQKSDAVRFLDLSRPKAKLTEIGLSPKVTKTLKEAGLDIDLKSIKSAIHYRWIHYEIEGKKQYMRNGEPFMVQEAYVKFSEGTQFNMTRFQNGGCEACGKRIPSRRFAPIEAKDSASNQLVGMWVGKDCAASLFGIKFDGVEKAK